MLGLFKFLARYALAKPIATSKTPNFEYPTHYDIYLQKIWSFFQGCFEAVKNKALENQHMVIGVSVGILALQILGIIFAFCLCKAIGKDRDYHYKYWHRDNAAAPNAASRPSGKPQQESEQQTFLQNLQWEIWKIIQIQK